MNPTPTEPMRTLLVAATMAPSSDHTTQPWAFHCDGNSIVLRADRTRSLPVNDPLGRDLTISCRAALSTMQAAAAAAGLTSTVQLTPDAVIVDLDAALSQLPPRAAANPLPCRATGNSSRARIPTPHHTPRHVDPSRTTQTPPSTAHPRGRDV